MGKERIRVFTYFDDIYLTNLPASGIMVSVNVTLIRESLQSSTDCSNCRWPQDTIHSQREVYACLMKNSPAFGWTKRSKRDCGNRMIIATRSRDGGRFRKCGGHCTASCWAGCRTSGRGRSAAKPRATARCVLPRCRVSAWDPWRTQRDGDT